MKNVLVCQQELFTFVCRLCSNIAGYFFTVMLEGNWDKLWYGNNVYFLCVLISLSYLWLFLNVCCVLFNSKHLVAPIWVKSCSMIVMDVWKMCFYVLVKFP